MPSARILLVDDDEAILQLVSDTLTRDGFLVSTAAAPSEALHRAKRVDGFKLVVCDVNLPEMNGFRLRDALHKLPEHAGTPFVFMSAADVAVEGDIATSLGADPLLLKPFTRADLRRVVHGALKFVRVTVGPLPGTLDRVFQDVADTHGTGILTGFNGPFMKRVVFQDGHVVFAASNDPRDLIGQAFIRAGLISEQDLLAAFERASVMKPEPGKPALAGALAALRRVTPEQSSAVFEQKIRESVLDLYLWPEGALEYVEGNVTDADLPFPIRLPLHAIREEGLKRRRRWRAVQKILPDPTVRFERLGPPWPEGFPRSNGDKTLVRRIEEGQTLADIRVEMRGQDYAVGMRLASFVKHGVLRTAQSTGFSGVAHGEAAGLDLHGGFDQIFQDVGSEQTGEFSAQPRTPAPTHSGGWTKAEGLASAAAFATALSMLRAGDLGPARIELLKVLMLDPMNTLARRRLEEVERTLATTARNAGLQDARRVELAVDIQSLAGKPIPPNDSFVLSRLAAGPLSVGDLLHLAPFPEHELLGILRRHLATGIVRWSE